MGGWGKNENKDHLSPAKAETRAELGNNPNYDPTKVESEENSWLMPITDCQGINDEFHQAFQKIYSKQDVEDNSEAIQEFLVSKGDTKPSE